MAVPLEDYDLRLRWVDPSALTSRVIDVVAASSDEVVAFIAWEAISAPLFQAGFSVIRFTSAGAIRWQSTHTLCGPMATTDCGNWVLLSGAITTDDGSRFIAVGTIINAAAADANHIESIGIGVDDGGTVAWCNRYQTTMSLGRPIGIAQLANPGDFLVVSRNKEETATWLYGIDRNGALLTTVSLVRFAGRFVQRLRALPNEGIFILGMSNEDPDHPLGWIMNVDPATGSPAWERTYDPHDGTALCWFDVAEGEDEDVLTVVGNNRGGAAKPFVATLADSSAPDVGNVRAAFRPAAEGVPIVVNGIANVPSPESTSSICGEFDGAAWQVAIDDSVNFLWQKKYNRGRSFATLTPITFTNSDAVVAGGAASVPPNPVQALLVASKVAIDSPGAFGCGEETNAVFEAIDLSSETIESEALDLIIFVNPWFVNQAGPLQTELGCLP